MNERIIALDIGDARIGVAVSDASRLIATPIDTIYRVGYGPDARWWKSASATTRRRCFPAGR